METFRTELGQLINKHSLENGSNTPDFILVEYLTRCLENFDITLQQREMWYGRATGNIKRSDTELQRIADTINYNNLCARATLGDLPKVTVEDLRASETQDNNGEIIFNDGLDEKTFSDAELENLANWLKSDEGKQKIREAQEHGSDIIDKLFDIDPKILREPFNI